MLFIQKKSQEREIHDTRRGALTNLDCTIMSKTVELVTEPHTEKDWTLFYAL